PTRNVTATAANDVARSGGAGPGASENLSTPLPTRTILPDRAEGTMDWNAAIETNREALRRVLAMLVAMVGSGPLGGTNSPETGFSSEPTPEAIATARPTLPRYLHRAVLALLRPAEAAARRLVIIVARDLVTPP